MDSKKANSIIREIRDNYNTIAADWDLSRNRPSAVKLKMLSSADEMLDLGCGNGLIVPAAINKVWHYTGLDISRNLIKIAKKRYAPLIKTGQVEFVAGDARSLPFRDSSFDLVVSYAVLHHIPGANNRQKVFEEIYRVLKPGAEARIINWNLLNDWAYKRFGIKKQLADPPTGLETNDVYVPWRADDKKEIKRFVHIFTAEELKSLARAAGFKNPRVCFYNRAGEPTDNGEEIVLKIKKSDV